MGLVLSSVIVITLLFDAAHNHCCPVRYWLLHRFILTSEKGKEEEEVVVVVVVVVDVQGD